MWVPHGKDLMYFSSFSDMADDGEATTLESGVRGVMWLWTWLMSVCKTHGFGICQQTGTTTVQKGIRYIRKMWSALYAWPCSSSQLFSNSFFSTWLARRRAGEQAQWPSNSSAQEAREGQGEPLAAAGGERDTHRKGVNMSVGGTSKPYMGRICCYILLDNCTQYFRLDRRPGAVSSCLDALVCSREL